MTEYLLEKARQKAETAISKKQTRIYIAEVNGYQEIEKILSYSQERNIVKNYKYSKKGYFIVEYTEKDSSHS